MDKQPSTKHYTEKQRSNNTNPTKNQGWTQVLQNCMQFSCRLIRFWDIFDFNQVLYMFQMCSYFFFIRLHTDYLLTSKILTILYVAAIQWLIDLQLLPINRVQTSTSRIRKGPDYDKRNTTVYFNTYLYYYVRYITLTSERDLLAIVVNRLTIGSRPRIIL
jgi:hypothetical protein